MAMKIYICSGWGVVDGAREMGSVKIWWIIDASASTMSNDGRDQNESNSNETRKQKSRESER